jgi:hypothetical protein
MWKESVAPCQVKRMAEIDIRESGSVYSGKDNDHHYSQPKGANAEPSA